MIVRNRNLLDTILLEEDDSDNLFYNPNDITKIKVPLRKMRKAGVCQVRVVSAPPFTIDEDSQTGFFYEEEKKPIIQRLRSSSFRSRLSRTLSMPLFWRGDADGTLCQGPLCKDLPIIEKQDAVKVCHHTECQEKNDMNPVLLCNECDSELHNGDEASHLRFDVPHPSFSRKGSMRSMNSDSGTEDDGDSVYRFDKKNRSYGSARRFFQLTATKSKSKLKKMPSVDDSSKEYFTLRFYDDNESVFDTEKVPVRKGKSLKDSIEHLFTNRDLDFQLYSVFLESSKTPLPLLFDTFPLGGNTLHVKANQVMKVDERIITRMKADEEKKNQSQRQKKILSILNENDPNASVRTSTMPANSKLTRKSGMFSSFKDVSRNMSDILAHYYTHGFDLETDNNDGVIIGTLDDLLLEESWTDVIVENDEMPHKLKIQQEILWELLLTERNYLRRLKAITGVFQRCLECLQQENFLTEVDSKRLFANIDEVYETNSKFWNEYLFHVIEEARRTKEPIRPLQFRDSFSKFEDLFEPYVKYCMEESSCVKYLKQLKQTNEMFVEYLAWCENHRQCVRLKLADLLVKPMQRVTKYGLLLKNALIKTTSEEDRSALENMISQVERFVTKINTTLRLRHEQQKIDSLLARFDLYIPVESLNEEMERIVLEYCSFDLRGKIPGLPEEEQRCILMEGPMKLVEKQGRNDVQAFLFTDLLLFAKAKKNGDKLRIIRQPYRLNKIVLHTTKDPSAFILVYVNEYGILVTAFTLVVGVNEYTKWKEAIDKAKLRYEKARAGHGSTLDFFDDDVPQNLQPSAAFISNLSPSPDRRSMTVSEFPQHSERNDNKQPSIVVTDDMNLRQPYSRASSEKQENVSEVFVKRSLSDPKTPWNRSASREVKPRPVSLIASTDQDTASWVLKNEKRERSGSIPSDTSNDSRRSSGIGDSFRSINSDSALPNKDIGISIPPYTSYQEVSNVAKLKARFEIQSCQSSNVEEDNSPLSATSGNLTSTETSSLANRRTTTSDHCTIQEEEEQSSNYSHEKFNTTNSLSLESQRSDDSSESLRTISNDLSNVDRNKSKNISSTFGSVDYMDQQTKTHNESATQTENFIIFEESDMQASSEARTFNEIGTQCDCNSELPVNIDAVDEHSNIELLDIQINDDVNYSNISTQYENLLLEQLSVSTQCENCRELQRHTSTQCGDFIQLTGSFDKIDENIEKDLVKAPLEHTVSNPGKNNPDKNSDLRSFTPILDMLSNSVNSGFDKHSNPEKLRGILKHSFSEMNLTKFADRRNEGHERSRSDEVRQYSLPGSPKNRNSAEAYDSPGMRALKTLSESLEFKIQHRSSSPPPKTNVSSTDDNNRQFITNRHNTGSKSPSLRRIALLNPGSSPNVNHKITHPQTSSPENTELNTSDKKANISRAKSESNVLSKDENKRYTWHFDSTDALERIQETKYGQKTSDSTETARADYSKLDKNISQSSYQLDSNNSPKKQRSFKKALLKKFTPEGRNPEKKLNRLVSSAVYSDSSVSDSNTSNEKMSKKQVEKAKKKQKKEQKQREKEDKKKEKLSKNRRRSSFSSNASDISKTSNEKQWPVKEVIPEIPYQ